MIRLLIADDHEVIRESLKTVLHATEFEVAAEANNATLAADLAIEHHVDIALLDITMPEGGGLAALAKIKAVRPETAVVMYSVHDAPRYIQRTRELGANGYLVKGATRKTLLQTLHDVHAGHSVWPPSNYGTDGSYT